MDPFKKDNKNAPSLIRAIKAGGEKSGNGCSEGAPIRQRDHAH